MALRTPSYLKDRELVETRDEQGNVHRRYEYCGDRYERRLTPSQRRTERYLGLLAAAVAGGLAVLAAVQDTPVNRGGFFGALSVLALIPVLGVLVGAVAAFCKKGDLTGAEYHERLILLRVLPLVGAALLLPLAVRYAIGGAWLAFGAALAAGAAYALVGVHEIKVPYIVHPGRKRSAE